MEKLIELLGEEEKKHCIELNHLKVKRAKTLARTDLSEDAINKELKELDDKMVVLNTEHGKLIDSISQKLSVILQIQYICMHSVYEFRWRVGNHCGCEWS